MKKRWMFVAAALTVALALVGCGQTTTIQAQRVALGGRTKALMREIKNAKDMRISIKGKRPINGQTEEVTMDIHIKTSTDDSYMDMHSSIGHTGLLNLRNKTYFILHDQKIYFIDAEDEPGMKPEDIFGDLDKYNKLTFSTGSEVLNGTKYDYEKAQEGDNIVRYYYDASGALKYVKGDGQEMIEILAFETKVDESKFTLPTGYFEAPVGQKP